MRFADEALPATAPAWSAHLLDPEVAGSVAHFYDTMSFGQHHLRGEVAPKRYASAQAAAAYVAAEVGGSGQYGRFVLEILAQADADIDFSRFDNDGPDGRPNSGDDDGVVDAVFLNVASAPLGFINRDATGVGGLGFEVPFHTDDLGRSGAPILISPLAGTVQTTPDASQAAGAMAHEYGHLLGLIDLYDVDWTHDPASPEQDSAGIGRWGLMGWGAQGWGDTPGPVPLSAWSRLRLGWARVDEPSSLVESLELEPVDLGGRLLRVPLSASEYLLLEVRRAETYYDRAIPAGGLLIWHVARILGANSFRWQVDLVCADGRWADAGYPLGTQPAPATGGDNLDFWAHDEAYRSAHGGNLGDATDPFDGVRYRAFTADTNPASVDADGVHTAAIEDIRLSDRGATFVVRSRPPVLELSHVAPRSDRIAAGAPVTVAFTVTNVGGTPARGLRAELRTDDPLLEILDPVIPVTELNPGASSIGAAVSPGGFPKVRFPEDLAAEHTARLELAIYADSVRFASQTTAVTGLPSHRLSVTVTDSGGTPLAGIPVTVSGASGLPYVPPRQLTDAQGAAVYHLARGSYTIQAAPLDTSLWGPRSFEVSVEAETELTLALPPVYTLSGRVFKADGSAPADLYVSVQQNTNGDYWGRSVWVDADGGFSLRVPAGSYQVFTRYIGVTSFSQDHGTVVVDADRRIELQLPDDIRIVADVVDEAGLAVDGARVQLRSGTLNSFTSSTSGFTRSGAGATFKVIPGTYTVLVDEVPVPLVADRSSLTFRALADTSVRLVVSAGLSVAGTLVDTDGVEQAFPGGVTPLGITFVDTASGQRYRAQPEPGSARFAIGLFPGVYRVAIDVFDVFGGDVPQAEFPSQTLGPIAVGSDTVLTLALDPGVHLDGYVLGYAPGPNDYGQLYLESASTSHYASIQSDGSYSLYAVPGEYSAYVFFSGEGVPPSQSVGTIAVAGDTTVNWRVQPGERVEGRLTDAAGAGLPAVSVSASSTSRLVGAYDYGSTGADGAFSLQLPTGRYSLSASRGRVSWWLGTFEVPATSRLDFVLPSGATLEPVVTDERGAAASANLTFYGGTFSLAEYMRQVWNPQGLTSAYLDAGVSPKIDMAPGRYFGIAAASSHAAARVVSTVVGEGDNRLAIELPPPPSGVTLSGRLSFAGATPLGYAVLAAYESASAVLTRAQIDAGPYAITLPPGTYELGVYYPTQDGYETWLRPGVLDLREDRELDLTPSPSTAVEDAQATPHVFALEPSYPNPFNATTSIGFGLPAAGPASLVVYDLLGQRVRTLVSGQRPAGPQRVVWDSRDDAGRPVASGVYLYRLATPGHERTRKLLLLR